MQTLEMTVTITANTPSGCGMFLWGTCLCLWHVAMQCDLVFGCSYVCAQCIKCVFAGQSGHSDIFFSVTDSCLRIYYMALGVSMEIENL